MYVVQGNRLVWKAWPGVIGQREEQKMYEMKNLDLLFIDTKWGGIGLLGNPVHYRVSVIFDVMSPTHGWLPIAPLIDISKDLRSNLSLEVA